ncbi:MAG: hypothetical protein ABSC37_00160 [Xanthobacteraceae bacterium]
MAEPKGVHKTLERTAHEVRAAISNLHYGFDLSKKFGKRKAHILSGMPQSTMTELILLRKELNKLFRGVERDNNSN